MDVSDILIQNSRTSSLRQGFILWDSQYIGKTEFLEASDNDYLRKKLEIIMGESSSTDLKIKKTLVKYL